MNILHHAACRTPWFHGTKSPFALVLMLMAALLSKTATNAYADNAGRWNDKDMEWVKYEYDTLLTYYRMTDLAKLESFFVSESSFYVIITPGPDTLVQPHRCAIPFDWQSFPSSFNDGLVGEWVYGEIPRYRVRVMEDPYTRELIFINADGYAFYSIPPPKDYNPYWLAEQRYPGILYGKYPKEWTEYILQWLDSSRVQMTFELIPTESFYDYLIYKAEADAWAVAQAENFSGDEDDGFFFIMRSEDELTILEYTLDGGNMVVSWQGDTNAYYRIQTTTNLIEGIWPNTDMMLGADEVMTWTETTSTIISDFAFLRVVQRDIADPGDTDGDGLDDVWEIQNGFNPLDPSDATLDADNDGLTNFQEYLNGTSPNNPDSSGNGVPDGWDLYNNQLIMGDVSGDGMLTGADLVAMDEILDGSAFNISPVTFAQADLDGNGVIDQTDRRALQDLLNGKPLLFVSQPTTGN